METTHYTPESEHHDLGRIDHELERERVALQAEIEDIENQLVHGGGGVDKIIKLKQELEFKREQLHLISLSKDKKETIN